MMRNGIGGSGRTSGWMGAALVVGALVLGACGAEGGRTEYANDGDTGAAAPATVQTPSPGSGVDSTAGVSQRTGERGVAGDTLGSKAKRDSGGR